MNKTKDKINSYFIEVFGDNPIENIFDENKVMYHYTSPEAFLSIVQEREIRFTDIRYLNDKSEGIYFVKILLEFLDENKDKYPVFTEVANELLKGNDYEKIKALEVISVKYNEVLGLPYKPMRKFVFCMCEDADSLNMWNYYVNNNSYQGYNIGFKIGKLLKGFDVPNDKVIDAFHVCAGKVLYNKTAQFDEIEKYAQKLEKAIEHSSHGGEASSRMAHSVAQLKLRRYIESKGIFYKHNKFKDEKEVRIVIEISEERIPRKDKEPKWVGELNKKMYEGFCVKRGLVVPVLTVRFMNEAINRITTAPMIEFDIAKASVKEMLKDSCYKGVKVERSRIPIRF